MKVILVTGASGFIGSNLVRKLVKGNNEIRVLIRKNIHPFLKNLDIKIYKGDVNNFDSIKHAIKNCDYISYS